MRVSSLIFFILSITFAHAQMVFSKLKHDFGEINSYDNRFVDVSIKNNGTKEGYILRVEKPEGIVYIQSKALIMSQETLTLRFQVNPKEKGKFKYNINIYTSDRNDAQTLTLTGHLLDITQDDRSYLTSCPDFNTIPANSFANDFEITVITIDAQTKEELSNSSVSLFQGGMNVWTKKTNKKGRIVEVGTIGMAYFYASHDGYISAEKGAYVTINRNRIVLELSRDANVIPPQDETQIVQNSESTDEVIITIEKDSQRVETQVQNPPEEVSTSIKLEELNSDNFDESFFSPVNIVFVIDVSGSMNQANKLELMKYSLNQLNDMIRTQDQIALVSYASQAEVILPPTSGAQKELIREKVKKIRAGGLTAGGEGIKIGLEQAKKSFISGGVNHVFVITDGSFNQEKYNYKRIIKKYVQKGIQLSVVGILNNDKAEASMREIASLGYGTYIPIFKLSDAKNNIKQSVRKLAFKHNHNPSINSRD